MYAAFASSGAPASRVKAATAAQILDGPEHAALITRVSQHRTTTFLEAKPPQQLTPSRTRHFQEANPNRVFVLAALAAHLAVRFNPPRQVLSRWI